MHIYRNMLQHAGILRAPAELSGFGSFGGGGGTGADGGQGGTGGEGGELGSTQQHPLIGEGEDGEEGDSELNELFSAFGGGDEDENFEPVNIGDIPQEDVDAMQTQVQSMIAQVRVPENTIPENFDPSDRTQLMALLNKTAQAAVSSSMGVVFKPVQLAMTQMAAQMKAHVDNSIKASGKQNRDVSVITDLVPEYNDKRYSGMLKGVEQTLIAQGKKPEERAKLMRKMLNQMGIQGDTGQGRRSSGGTGQGGTASVRTGKSALDSFFGAMPKIG